MDALNDNSHRVFIDLAERHESLIPEYVMTYSLPDKTAAEKLDSGLFADPDRRLFPVDTPASTWLSAAYFLKRAEDHTLKYSSVEAPLICQGIMKAAEIHGITDDVSKLSKQLAAKDLEKLAENDNENYGWVQHDNLGNVVARKYPMFDSAGVKLACDYFRENRGKYPLVMRKTIAGNIVKRAAALDIDVAQLDETVRKEAGYGIPSKATLMNEIYERAHLTKDAEVACGLANINELVAGLDDNDIAVNLDKIAEVLEEFDRFSDLTKYYGRRILMPSDFLYGVSLKEAEAVLDDAVELDKFVFSVDKLAELPTSVFGDVLGDAFVGSITDNETNSIDRRKLSDNLFSLPRPDKIALEARLAAL